MPQKDKGIKVLGIDLGKNSCSVVGLDERGIVAMEERCGAHYLGRLFAAHGPEIRLMSPEYVRPYVKAQKNDDRDAEAATRPKSAPSRRWRPPPGRRDRGTSGRDRTSFDPAQMTPTSGEVIARSCRPDSGLALRRVLSSLQAWPAFSQKFRTVWLD